MESLHLRCGVARACLHRVHAKLLIPTFRLPDLALIHEVRCVVILAPGEVPSEPADAVRFRRGLPEDLLLAEAFDRLLVITDAAIEGLRREGEDAEAGMRHDRTS